MKLPVSMRWRRWIIWLLLPCFAGCSALRLGYNQAPTLAYWWLDGYADFGPEQAPRVKLALADWFAWHRATELPDYAQALATLGAMAVNTVTAEQVCEQVEAWQRRAERAFEQAVPAMAEQVRTLSAEQLRHIEQRQTARQADRAAEFLQADPAKRRQAAFDRVLDRAETVYGRLDEGQRTALATAQAASPFDPAAWLAELRQRNAEVLRSLRQWQAGRADAATVAAGLRRLAAETRQSPRADYRAQARRVALFNCALVAQLHNASTPAQRQHAADTFRGWEADLRALADPR